MLVVSQLRASSDCLLCLSYFNSHKLAFNKLPQTSFYFPPALSTLVWPVEEGKKIPKFSSTVTQQTSGTSARPLQKFSSVLSQMRNSSSFGIRREVTLSQVKWGNNRDQNQSLRCVANKFPSVDYTKEPYSSCYLTT